MKETGELLKQQRESKGITLNEVALATKINIKVLKSIESGELDKLPAKTFLRGFLKSYAQFLKIDVNLVLNKFYEEVGESKPEVPKENLINAPAAQSVNPDESIEATGGISNISLFKKISFSFGIFLLVCLIFYVKHLIDKYERESVQNPIAIEKNKEIESKASEVQMMNEMNLQKPEAPVESANKPIDTTVATPAVALPITPVAPAHPATHAAKVETKPAAPVATTLPAKTVPLVSATPPPKAITPNDIKPTETKPTEAKPAVVEKKPTELILEALDKVEVSYTLDNGKTTKLSLNPDQIHSIKAKGIIKISISNGGAVNIIHNGKDKGIAGTLGKPVSLNF